MKKLLLATAALWLLNTAFAQHESIGPITQMYRGPKTAKPLRAGNTIDSTFIYITDTLSLPLFDDFSRSKFQQYDAQPTDPEVVGNDLYHLLLDMSNNPLPASAKYSLTQTNRYVTDMTDTTTDTLDLPSLQIRVGNFLAFPVVYTPTTVYPAYDLFDTINGPTADVQDTIFMTPADLIQDSARVFTVHINNPDAIWLDNSAYHNYTWAKNPWSLGVVTFDGLDANGYPYNIGTNLQGRCDYLTSKPLDLSGYLPQDSLYLNFLVQPQGYGDEPEANDSLVLEFYNVLAGEWNDVWSFRGRPVTEFKVAHVKIAQSIYLRDGFQFRFWNKGHKAGALDEFHIDYIDLRPHFGGIPADSIFRDFAWSYPVGSMLKDYTSVPWDHWKAISETERQSKMNNATHVVVRNSHRLDQNNNPSTVKVKYNGVEEGSFTMNPITLTGNPGQNYLAMTTVESYHDFSAGYSFDESKAGKQETFDIVGHASIPGGEEVFYNNDTAYSKQVFSDYYAYDDGSAEAVYGPTGVQARLAIKYTSYVPDSIIGVRMHFLPSIDDVSNKLFLLTVWGDNNGVPGTVLYEDDFFFPRMPQYEEGFGGFTEYFLPDTMKLAVPTTFYVGWRQIDAERLNIGFDWNNDNADKIFFSINGGTIWQNTTYQGSAMIRPIIATELNHDLSVSEQQLEPSWTVYPNPTSGTVSIQWDDRLEFPGATVRDGQGRAIAVAEDAHTNIDLSGVPAGIYFLQLNGLNGQVKKIVRY